MDNSTPIKNTLTILIDYIKEQLTTETLDILPSPTPSTREEKNAYEELSMVENDYTIIKSAWPIDDYIPYIIYMVRYDERYWVVSLPHKDSTTKYCIKEYFPPPQEK